MNKILIADQNFNNTELIDKINNKGYKVVANEFHRRLLSQEIVRLGKDCVGIIAGGELYNEGVLDKLSKLQCISRCGAGLDNIDLEHANRKRIIVKNTPDAPARAVAELTIGLMFALLRNIPQCDKNTRDGKWEKPMGNLLQGKTVGILGLGKIGKIVAELLLGLGVKVIGSDVKYDWKWAGQKSVKIYGLSDLLMASDILTIHVSSSPKERPIISKFTIDFMKEGAYIINTSRGNVIDEEALYEALKDNYLAGAAFDVFKKEPYKGKLAELDNVILTSHIGSYTVETRREMEKQAVNNLLESLENG